MNAPSGTDAPTRIHRVIARLNVGGPAIHVVLLSRGLEAHGFRTRLLAGEVTEDEGDMAYFAAQREVEVHRLPRLNRTLSPWADFQVFLALLRTFLRERPAVVHTHTAKAGTLGRLAAFLARVPLRVHTYHGHVLGGSYFSPFATRVFLAMERALARITHRIVVLTEDQRREMAEELRIGRRERYRVIPLGLELDPFSPPGPQEEGSVRAEVRRELGLEEETVVVGSVGRLVPVKNHELLLLSIRPLERLLSRRIRLLVVGGGEREAELQERAREWGVEDRVLWLGWRRDLPRLYRAMDVLALPSHDEGTPVAVIEALVAGVPVVARAVGGVPEVLEEGDLGRLVEGDGRDPLALSWAFASALARTLEAPPGEEERERARTSALRRFGVERLCRDMAELYREGLGPEGRG